MIVNPSALYDRADFFYRRDDGYDDSEDMNPVVLRDLDVFEFLPVAGAKNYFIRPWMI